MHSARQPTQGYQCNVNGRCLPTADNLYNGSWCTWGPVLNPMPRHQVRIPRCQHLRAVVMTKLRASTGSLAGIQRALHLTKKRHFTMQQCAPTWMRKTIDARMHFIYGIFLAESFVDRLILLVCRFRDSIHCIRSYGMTCANRLCGILRMGTLLEV